MSSAQYLIDSATRHQVFLQRYAGGQSKEALTVLDRLIVGINARLSQEPTVFQAQRLEAVLRDIELLSINLMGGMTDNVVSGTQDLIKSESAFSAKLFDKATVNAEFTIPSDSILISNVMSSSMSLDTNVTINSALRQFTSLKTKEITRTISDGVTLGETTPQIARNLSTKINTLQKRQLDSLVRTITNHSSSVARKEVFSANKDIMDGYRWVSTLDSRTTLICGGRDGGCISRFS